MLHLPRAHLHGALWCLGAPAQRSRVHGRWTFGSALYPAGNFKGMANLKWTCKSPCTSRNYLIQVPLPPANLWGCLNLPSACLNRSREYCKGKTLQLQAWTSSITVC